jgi:hypothetical protein
LYRDHACDPVAHCLSAWHRSGMRHGEARLAIHPH